MPRRSECFGRINYAEDELRGEGRRLGNFTWQGLSLFVHGGTLDTLGDKLATSLHRKGKDQVPIFVLEWWRIWRARQNETGHSYVIGFD